MSYELNALHNISNEIEKQTKNQEKIIDLLQQLITMVAASAISSPLDSVGNYERMNAANYAERHFTKNK